MVSRKEALKAVALGYGLKENAVSVDIVAFYEVVVEGNHCVQLRHREPNAPAGKRSFITREV
jgi:hypothetical protein